MDSERYSVVRNDENQYSIWAADRALPDGWHAVGRSGSREECLAHIREVWTDLTPASLVERR
jgi:MbtH protein